MGFVAVCFAIATLCAILLMQGYKQERDQWRDRAMRAEEEAREWKNAAHNLWMLFGGG